MTSIELCPTCNAPLPHQHCFDCGARLPHACDCPGPIDWDTRKRRALAFLQQERKPWQTWADLPYDYQDVQ